LDHPWRDASVYLGLSHYLEWTLKETLSQQAKQIGESWLGEVGVSGESYVAEEINEHFSPKVNGRFVRITRGDGSVMYLSDEPESKRFDPSRVPPLKAQADRESLREEHLTADSELMIFAKPFTAKDNGRYVIEVGAPNHEIERVLHGLLLAIAIGLPVVVSMAMAGGYLLMRRALRPVDEITQSAERITSRNLGERLPVAELTSSATEQMRLLAEDKDIALRCESEQQVRVEGDRARLKQVIVNLVDNAIKYTPAGGLVGVKVSASNGRAVIEVNDNGVGIPPEALPHIFERFYRVDKARSRQMGGAGLGLSIIKAIVTAHGG
jgi:anti-sigma regulatory factor (Ser/Thr protein kinase)